MLISQEINRVLTQHNHSQITSLPTPIVRYRGLEDILHTWHAMQDFTQSRDALTNDEIWLVEHPSVFTLGLAGKMEHILNPGDIPIVNLDRGGQVTYHAPGQIIAYVLLDIRRRNYGVKELVRRLEETIIRLLGDYAVSASRKIDAPGVYVDDAKIASLGLRVKHGCCYHGLALNTSMDLLPFSWINPCGYPGLKVTQTSLLGITDSIDMIQGKLVKHLLKIL